MMTHDTNKLAYDYAIYITPAIANRKEVSWGYLVDSMHSFLLNQSVHLEPYEFSDSLHKFKTLYLDIADNTVNESSYPSEPRFMLKEK
jgi:hypothetical protein